MAIGTRMKMKLYRFASSEFISFVFFFLCFQLNIAKHAYRIPLEVVDREKCNITRLIKYQINQSILEMREIESNQMKCSIYNTDAEWCTNSDWSEQNVNMTATSVLWEQYNSRSPESSAQQHPLVIELSNNSNICM